jgi:hypothetical protein
LPQVEFRSVIPSSEFITEVFNLLLHGTRVSAKFSPDWMSIITERARRVLKIHPEFQAMTDREQVCIQLFN